MPAPYTPEIHVDGGTYFPAPYSIDPLPRTLQRGLIPLGVFASLSVASTLALISFICFRMLAWKSHYRAFIGYNQYVILVLNLLLADLQQSSAFLISFHWLHRNSILAPHAACFAQGWLLHSGDVSSGLFVLAIALHTFYTAVYGQRIGNGAFIAMVLGVWIFVFILTAIGAVMHGERYFVRAGAWCWISSAYQTERLALHYIWIFVSPSPSRITASFRRLQTYIRTQIVQFGTVLIYLVTFHQLRQKTSKLFAGHRVGHNTPNASTVAAVNRITKMMMLYPCVYVVLTLPLSAGRMWTMAHHGRSASDTFACVAGSLLTSCGWVDSLLYTLTRRRLLQDTMPSLASGSRRAEGQNWEADQLGSTGITHTRTVTVEGGRMMELKDTHAHRGAAARKEMGGTARRTPSPSGSVDPILKGRGRGKTDVSVGMRDISEDEGR